MRKIFRHLVATIFPSGGKCAASANHLQILAGLHFKAGLPRNTSRQILGFAAGFHAGTLVASLIHDPTDPQLPTGVQVGLQRLPPIPAAFLPASGPLRLQDYQTLGLPLRRLLVQLVQSLGLRKQVVFDQMNLE